MCSVWVRLIKLSNNGTNTVVNCTLLWENGDDQARDLCE